MTRSRKSLIVALAEEKSRRLILSFPEGGRARGSAEAINSVCKRIIERKTPYLPTARLIAEIGGAGNPAFPSEQTIYNGYRKILAVWRRSFHDIINIDFDPPMSMDDVAQIDTSIMDISTAKIVDDLKAILVELNQRCNGLKRLIDEAVPVAANEFRQAIDADALMHGLRDWSHKIADSGFQLDEVALKVSRRTPVGTRVMDFELFDKLKTFADEYERMRRAREAFPPDAT
jgi:hypothetical protein